jgi:hypothetical protein
MMQKITFNRLLLIEEATREGERFISPSVESFSELPSTFHTLIDNVYYEVNAEKDDAFLWVNFEYGKPEPIDEKLTNVNTGEKRENEREDYEAELLEQLFVLYDFRNKILFLSNIRKEKLFEKVLQNKLNKQFIVERLYKNREDFISTLKQIDQISFTEARNIFNLDSKKRQALIDLTGTDAPEKFTLSVEYGVKRDFLDLVEFVKELMDSKQNSQLKELVIRGVAENDFEFVFNVDSFVEKITVECEKETSGKFNPEKVKMNLLARIQNERK